MLDPEEGRRQQHEAENRVEKGTDPGWRNRARAAMLVTASQHRFFTTDEVWERLGEKPREPRAMSGIIRWATTRGYIEFTGEMVPTARPEAHRNPKREYHSLIYKGEGQ